MYVAPLNLDLFFKKVFSNKDIVKKFLESILDKTITEVEILKIESKVTDAAVTVKFDYRCKIGDEFVIIEMQQKYKVDVVKRFYLYHSVATSLQLESLKPITVVRPNGKTYKEKDYSELKPVITIVWMVDDMLGFEDDYVAFTTLPEVVRDFVEDKKLWRQPIEKILDARKQTLKILENKTKGLDFFEKNRMIYLFQRNIVKNRHNYLPYYKWFDFANKSLNPDNTEEDFLIYKNDEDMVEMIDRLKRDNLSDEEFHYVSDLYNYEILMGRMELDYKETIERHQSEIKKRESEIQQKESEIQQKESEIQQKESEIQQKESEIQQKESEIQQKESEIQQKESEIQQKESQLLEQKQKAENLKNKLLKSVTAFLNQGFTIPMIAETLELSIEETTELVNQVNNK